MEILLKCYNLKNDLLSKSYLNIYMDKKTDV